MERIREFVLAVSLEQVELALGFALLLLAFFYYSESIRWIHPKVYYNQRSTGWFPFVLSIVGLIVGLAARNFLLSVFSSSVLAGFLIAMFANWLGRHLVLPKPVGRLHGIIQRRKF